MESTSSKPPITTTNDSSSSVRVSSPLNPLSSLDPSPGRPRAKSASSGTAVPSMSLSPSSALSMTLLDDEDSSTSRLRSRSASSSRVVVDTVWKKVVGSSGASISEKEDDKWKSSSKRREIPPEQREGWEYTRKRVMQVASSILGTTLDVTHEALILSTELLEFAPVPGLQNIAKTLLHIWDSLQDVDMHRLQCLHLTERCADILLSVRQEIHDAGDLVGEELNLPIQKLSESFRDVFVFLQKQIHRPFLKRYLKRDEIQREIAGCHQSLHEALGMFSLSIQIRILKQVQESDRRREKEMQTIMDALGRANVSIQPSNLGTNALGLEGIEEDRKMTTSSSPASRQGDLTPTMLPSSGPSNLSALSLSLLPSSSVDEPGQISTPSTNVIISSLVELVAKQNSVDAAADTATLRNVLKSAVAAGSDLAMVETLGVERNEMAEAIKTLQRALERVLEGKSVGGSGRIPVKREQEIENEAEAAPEIPSKPPPRSKGRLIKMVRRLSVQGSSSASPSSSLKRSGTSATIRTSSSGSSGEEEVDTLDREFLESGIDALRRMSEGHEATLSLPSWTITKFEVERTHKVGIGFFSDVYKGTWRGRTVAIKVLAQTTPRDLFIKEVEIWKKLQHPNVLELYGASSTSGDAPWFLVSAYLKEGTLVEFLRRAEGGLGERGVVARRDTAPDHIRKAASIGSTVKDNHSGLGLGLGVGLQVPGSRGRTLSGSSVSMIDPKGYDLLKFMYEIAKGMAYLHSQGVLHGDLKASNVLVTDRHHCVITDFGQSEMRSEAYRLSGTPPPHGTLRWQAPELMTGTNQLTTEIDVYAFAICCIEILSMGKMPWPLADDIAVRHFVLNENSRPPVPYTPFSFAGLHELLRLCWHRDPFHRPAFSRIVGDLKSLRKSQGISDEVMSPTQAPSLRMSEDNPESPDMHPIPIPAGTPPHTERLGGLSWEQRRDRTGISPGTTTDTTGTSYGTARETSTSPIQFHGSTGPQKDLHMPTGMVSHTTSLSGSEATTNTTSESEEDSLKNLVESDGYDYPQPTDKRLSDTRDERRYRLLLSHGFHPSLVLPLWSPTQVSLGAIGYLQKPEGTFVTLFNAINPELASEFPDGLATVWGFGKVTAQSQRVETRTATQKGFDILAGMFNFRKTKEGEPTRRYSHPLRAGHKAAFMYTESTTYKYLENLDAPKDWFKANVDTVLKTYGEAHRIGREDVCFVIGTLNTADYALFVSHNHPDGQAHFNVLPTKAQQPWGAISTSTEVSQGGPSYDEPIPGGSVSHWKVSRNGDAPVTVLLARLRFKTDASVPTSV